MHAEKNAKLINLSGDEVVSLQTISKYSDLTERRVNQLAKEGVIPRADRGKYLFLGCITGYIKYLRLRAEGGSLSLTDERTRLTRAQAEAEELKVKALRGEFISADIAIQIWDRIVMAFRSRLLALPRKAAPIILTLKSISEISDMLEKIIYEALNELSRINPADYTKDLAGNQEDEPTAKAQDKRVGRPKKNTKPGGKRRAGAMADIKG